MVDDEIDYLTLLKLRLVNEGFDIATSDNAEEALAAMKKDPPDLVVADVMMPGTDGIAMFRKMREANAHWGDTPLIFLSGRDESQTKVDALHLGAEDYIVKPVDLKELAARIRNIIRRGVKGRKAAPGAPLAAGVVGDLKDLGVSDIVQTLHLGLKTACVRIAGKGGEGKIWFGNGRIRHAELGNLSGELAFYEMLTWQEGRFVIEHGLSTKLRTIEMDGTQLLMEGLRRLDEERKEDPAG
jgi:DNA-binding response OmpR family regulator